MYSESACCEGPLIIVKMDPICYDLDIFERAYNTSYWRFRAKVDAWSSKTPSEAAILNQPDGKHCKGVLAVAATYDSFGISDGMSCKLISMCHIVLKAFRVM